MTKRMLIAQLAAGVLFLVLVMLMESFTDADMDLQRLWFDSDTHEWIVSNALHERLTWVFYDGPKTLLIALGVFCIGGFFIGGRRRASPEFRRGCLLLLFSLAFVPMLLGGAKQFTNVYCPKQLEAFGGDVAHQGVLECRKVANEGRSAGKCFPAGHASGGFALMMLFFCLPQRRRWAGLALGLAAGWSMGLYQMLRGQHFLSHTLFTMAGAWMIILLIAWALRFVTANHSLRINICPSLRPFSSPNRNSAYGTTRSPNRLSAFKRGFAMYAFADAVRYLVRRLLPFIVVYFLAEFMELSVLALRESSNLHPSLQGLFVSLPVWVGTTTVSCLFSLLPVLLYLLILPRKSHGGRWDRRLTMLFFFLYTASNLFEEVSELLFWDEFTSRFNFVAVDYLVYTQEVVGNIMQSYPVALFMGGILLAAVVFTVLARHWLTTARTAPRLILRFAGALLLALCACSLNMVNFMDISEDAGDRYLSELSKDGLYSLFHAFFSNELSYNDFYLTRPDADVVATLAPKLASDARRVGDPASLVYEAAPKGPELRANVIIVLMESMGSEFFSEFRSDGKVLTPNLEALAARSLYFSHVYSTGTRTVRGIEALTLARPPLPGMPIVRLEGNDNLHGIWDVFRARGYDTKWIYGGYGYFDNMNAYFAGNGFTVVDRTVMSADEITFSNIWGVCDENLFARTIKEADASHAAGKPFFNFVLTTSNHRPYTYPEGKIGIPSKSGRNGGVMYADYAIGEFMKEARRHPWFDDTVFVFVADHGASSSGREEIKPGNHHIPLIVHAPKFIKPERHDRPISQIDAVPTLLSLLRFTYTGEFYGMDALDPNYVSRYFLSNYQKLAYVKGDEMVILRPVRGVHFYRGGRQVGSAQAAEPGGAVKAPDAALQQVLDEGVSYYQHSARWREFLKE